MAGDRNDLSSEPHVNLRSRFFFSFFVGFFLILIYFILELKTDWVTKQTVDRAPTNAIYILYYE